MGAGAGGEAGAGGGAAPSLHEREGGLETEGVKKAKEAVSQIGSLTPSGSAKSDENRPWWGAFVLGRKGREGLVEEEGLTGERDG